MTQSMLRSLSLGDRAYSGRFLGLAGNYPASTAPSTAVLTLRLVLVAGCAVSVGIAAWLGDPSGYLHADLALARLLRGMAVIKGMIALGAVGLVFWRLAWRASKVLTASYIVFSWTLAGSAMLIWQLSLIVPAALIFHSAALSLLLAGWRDR